MGFTSFHMSPNSADAYPAYPPQRPDRNGRDVLERALVSEEARDDNRT
jgi:hypothetical protein